MAVPGRLTLGRLPGTRGQSQAGLRNACMKQVAQRPKDGAVSVVDVPAPALRPGWLLVANRVSLISAGTERTKIVTGEKNLLQKARARPDLVKKVVDKARVEGIRSALDTARDRLEALAPIGYSSAGVVLEVGEGVEGIAPGDRVACGGEGGEPRRDPRRAEEPRRARPRGRRVRGRRVRDRRRDRAARRPPGGGRGSATTVGVIGLGLVGQLAARLLAAAGCRVVGIDLDDAAVELRPPGRRDRAPRATTPRSSRASTPSRAGSGLDAVLLCASSASSDPLELAVAPRARPRPHRRRRGDADRRRPGAAVREGARAPDVPLVRPRPLRPRLRGARPRPPRRLRPLDRAAQHAGVPRSRRLPAASNPSELTTHRFPIDDAAEAYRVVTHPEGGERAFGVLLEYAEHAEPSVAPPSRPRAGGRRQAAGVARDRRRRASPARRSSRRSARRARGSSRSRASRGLSAADVASRFGFERAAARSTRSSPTTASARSSSRRGTRATHRSPPPRSAPGRPSSSRSPSP